MDSEATTERSSDGVVTASYRANIASGCTKAVEVIGHLHVDGELLSFSLRETILSGNVVGDIELYEVGRGIAALVEITLVWASTIGVDLVDGDCERGPLLYRCYAVRDEFLLRFTTNINVTIDLSTTARVYDVGSNLAVPDDRRIYKCRVSLAPKLEKGT